MVTSRHHNKILCFSRIIFGKNGGGGRLASLHVMDTFNHSCSVSVIFRARHLVLMSRTLLATSATAKQKVVLKLILPTIWSYRGQFLP